MGDLFRFFWQHFLSPHLDTILQVVSNIVAARIPPRSGKKGTGKRSSRSQRKEELVRRRKAEHQLHLYLDKLLKDRHMTRIHILGMHHPLPLEDIYVQAYVHSESALRYALDSRLQEAEETHDPNLLLNAAQAELEHRLESAMEPAEAIRTYKRCVIVGSPGAGKTTLLRYLAIKSARKELPDLPSIPLYLQLNTFDPTTHKDLTHLIMAQFDSYTPGMDEEALHELIGEKMRSGQIILLLDGLDETKFVYSDEEAERSYVAMVESIKQIAAVYPQLPIVVTARKAGYQYRPKLQGFDELEIVEFRPAEFKRTGYAGPAPTEIKTRG